MRKLTIFILSGLLAFSACKTENENRPESMMQNDRKKEVIYQVFTRLFGNTNSTNKPWGTIEENGVGKFADFSETALKEIKDLGVTYIWYTGVPHHDVITDYTAYGISNDDPDVVKGRAGSPYAVKDYYNVNPDLAADPANRLQEFEALIKRTHEAGLKLLIDIVPNHVARNYQSLSKPEGVSDFGENDDTTVEYSRDNNFYYIPGESFKVPNWDNGYLPLGGEPHPLVDGKFDETPAKWTGNGSRAAQPNMHDWYETAKINYGVRPDGSYDFDMLPDEYATLDYKAHFEFWQNKNVPDSWVKFRDIALYWIDKGVDGFRYDMSEMVPAEFWSYMNSAIKMKKEDAFLLAEIYNPAVYRDYIHKGKMDYLYDKVQLYDTIKHVMQGHGSTDNIPPIQNELMDIEHHMLHFLENHDEQRIASPDFAGSAEKGKPAMVVSATISSSPTLVYFAQELGEPGAEDAGFGKPTRTSIFDYIGVPSLQRWMNDKKFDGGSSRPEELALRDFYSRLLNFTINSSALAADYYSVHEFNRERTENYNDKLLSYARWSKDEHLLVIANFDPEQGFELDMKLPSVLVEKWRLDPGSYKMTDQLYGEFNTELIVDEEARLHVKLSPLQSFILKLEK